MKKFFTLIAAALIAGSAFAQGEGFVNVVKNGNLNANDMTNFKANDYWDDGTRLTRVYNPDSGQYHYHQNFSFAYQGFGFLAFDFNPR